MSCNTYNSKILMFSNLFFWLRFSGVMRETKCWFYVFPTNCIK